MSDDRTLLEMAAKAAGMRVIDGDKPWPKEIDDAWFWCEHGSRGAGIYACGYRHDFWGPLNDDGDALRLAVKCHIDIMIFASHTTATSVSWDGSDHFCRTEPGDDPYAATRRAIVCAAAEMGVAPAALGEAMQGVEGA